LMIYIFSLVTPNDRDWLSQMIRHMVIFRVLLYIKVILNIKR
jgi:hypothetical protein